MGDLLVPLYSLDTASTNDPDSGFRIQRPLAADKHRVAAWVKEHFSERWASETEIAFSDLPPRCFIALDSENQLVGFACYDAAFRGFFGPTGVAPEFRGHGLGTRLLLRSLDAMREAGYAYVIIGGSGADEYYEKTVGAIPIPDSTPGPYREWIKPEE
ncbi:MAG: GNAT family N-acetyltransferase [Verrucomicrobiales bacterium]|nr:GNAT family N-acetyltransferase [Verrucomicrobiales bacterium]